MLVWDEERKKSLSESLLFTLSFN